MCLHGLFTSVVPGITCLHWHPSMTGPLTTAFSISDNGENLLFVLPQLIWKQALAPNQHLIRLGQKVVNAL